MSTFPRASQGEGTGLLEGQGEGADGEEPAVMVYDGGEGAAPAAEDPAAEGADEGSAEGSAEGGAQGASRIVAHHS